MRKHFLLLVIILVAISLAGLIFTQIFWLNKSVAIAENQYDDRADRMLHDIVSELRQFSDTSSIQLKKNIGELIIFDVIDTTLLADLVAKYNNYHRLDSIYHYALVRTFDEKIIYSSKNFHQTMEDEAYKACLSCLWHNEYIHLSIVFPRKTINIYRHILSWIILSVLFLLIIISVFSFIVYSLIKQKKISEIRNDFINNMTHEFKTPISTISLASEILMKNSQKPTIERIQKYSRIIYDENKRMQTQVELVLQTALIDRQKIKLKKETKNIHEIIISLAENFCMDQADKQVSLNYNLSATRALISIDSAHIRNVLSNIIDNGIKYAGTNPKINIDTKDVENGILIQIQDNGIGMSRDTQNRIFEKFYRVSTGNVHDVKGFGLGLYYVKTIIEAHEGSVFVKSTLNKGSSFTVFLPGV